MPAQLKIIDNFTEWDRFVFAMPGSSYGHLSGWQRVIEQAYGHSPLYLAIQGSPCGEIRAILPLFRFKRPFCRPDGVSIPFFDQAGILARDPESGTLLLQKAGAMLAGKGAGAMVLRQGPDFEMSDFQIREQAPRVYSEKVGLGIPLAPDRQQMMAGFPSKLRSQIHKGMKHGLTWDIGKARLVDPFYQVFSRNMRDLGSPVHSKPFFKLIFACFPAHAFICVVYYQGKPAAAGFMFRFKDRLANPWASSLREFRHLNTNMLLYWQMIGFACNLGLHTFDMGRSSKGAATYRFKRQWRPKETPLSWYSWQLDQGKPAKETLSLPSWAMLPQWGANLAGPRVRKYISL